VLKKTGCVFVNIGDSYAGSGKGAWANKDVQKEVYVPDKKPYQEESIPAKSLCQIPERFTLMMTDELGFIKRNTVVWWKRNCMPSSSKYRFTVDWEPVYFYTKSQKYYFEQQFEISKWGNECWSKKGSGPGTPYEENNPRKRWGNTRQEIVSGEANEKYGQRNKRCVWDIPTQPSNYDFCDKCNSLFQGTDRNLVVTITVIEYGEEIEKRKCPKCGSTDDWLDHFAVFPEKLITPMILAGCPKEICNKCGKAREKIYKKTATKDYTDFKRQIPEEQSVKGYRNTADKETIPKEFIDYSDCQCGAGFHPGLVLDPFIGSGTTGKVALAYGRNYIGFDLGYDKMSKKRTSIVQLEAFI